MSIAVSPFIDEFAGNVLSPGEPGYDDARAVFNGAIDRRPALIAQVCDARDVAAALRHAEREDLPVAVRCGGHSGAGFGVIDDGLVIDVRRLKRIEVDLERRVVRAGAGLTWGELDAATQAHGLAVTGGRMSTTGVAGLTLGSGSGWLERKHGLTADNLLSATVVTADGDIVRTDPVQHPDLFWALRGGGGNFAIVTEFELALHQVGPIITAGMLLFAWERAEEVLRAYRDVMAAAPDELGGCAALQLAPPAPFVPAGLVGKPVLAIIVAAFADDEKERERLVAPLRALAPLIDVVAPMPYVALQQITDQGCPQGMQNHWKAAFLDDLFDTAIADAIAVAADIPSPLTVVLLQPLGGAYARVEEGATALSHRGARWAYHALSLWPDPADTPVNRAWTTRFADTMAAYGDGSAHPNHVSDPAGTRVRAFYGEETYARLVAVKDRWDPRNVFAANQNIRPSGS
ncbi:MAG TPA: FAD-binding oxidoreductase [Solirubrobacteraceae bacterium]|nr:FAD-binding oxidoreductase [Solirubrobacteraceae bacterium]